MVRAAVTASAPTPLPGKQTGSTRRRPPSHHEARHDEHGAEGPQRQQQRGVCRDRARRERLVGRVAKVDLEIGVWGLGVGVGGARAGQCELHRRTGRATQRLLDPLLPPPLRRSSRSRRTRTPRCHQTAAPSATPAATRAPPGCAPCRPGGRGGVGARSGAALNVSTAAPGVSHARTAQARPWASPMRRRAPAACWAGGCECAPAASARRPGRGEGEGLGQVAAVGEGPGPGIGARRACRAHSSRWGAARGTARPPRGLAGARSPSARPT
jgi:hypothetical protein